jgi:hypothetical protein
LASAKGQRNAAIWNDKTWSDNQTNTTNMLEDYSKQATDSIQQGTQQATDTQQGSLTNQLSGYQQTYDKATGQLTDAYGQARSDVNANYGAARDTYGQGRDASLGEIDTGLSTSLANLDQGYGAARGAATSGIANFDGWVDTGKQANTAQSNFLGLGGAAGSGEQAAALETWRNATGYQDILDQTTDQALRKASVVGGLGGNQIAELGNIGARAANQTGQQYFDNLGGLSARGLTAAQSQQQGYTTLANLEAQYGKDSASLNTNAAGQRAGYQDQYGARVGANQQAQGDALAKQSENLGTSLAGLTSDYGDDIGGAYQNYGNEVGGYQYSSGKDQAAVYQDTGKSIAGVNEYTTKGKTGNVSDAGKASDAAKNANEQTAVNIFSTVAGAAAKAYGAK